MSPRLLLQDACVLINLLASGRFVDIAGGCGYRLLVATAVRAEALYIRDDVTGEPILIDLSPHLTAGLLEEISVETEVEREAYITYAAQLDDGEAMSLALAEARHLILATDDRKARALIIRESIRVELSSTVGVLETWERNAGIPAAEMRVVLEQIQRCARFSPPATTAEGSWWKERLAGPIQQHEGENQP
jgi:predicted nucleic acid-binding protein